MAISAELLDKLRLYLDGAVTVEDLVRSDWRRQTDVVQQAFTVARMYADLGGRAVLIDGHASQRLKALAVASASIKQFFNRRCHDYGLKSRRMLIMDTVTTRAMGGRGNSRQRLHFHGVVELPEGWSKAQLIRVLQRIFGNAREMGRRQFHLSGIDWNKRSTHNGVTASGPLGKMLYAIKHAGSTYRCLDLNEGKRSRRAPSYRRACNTASQRLAQGIPSNFNKAIVLCDTASKRAGKEGFEAWLRNERLSALPVTTKIRGLKRAA